MVPNTVSRWLCRMLSCRRLEAHWGSHSEEVKVGKGCPQGGVLSPTMWCLVIEHVPIGLMRHVLGILQAWCESFRLSVNPDKVNVISFTTRYKAKPIRGVQLSGKPLKLGNEAKYLGVTLDSKLNWGKHISKIYAKAINSFWTCRSAFGNTWGLSPDNVKWMYEAIIRPRLTQEVVIWSRAL